MVWITTSPDSMAIAIYHPISEESNDVQGKSLRSPQRYPIRPKRLGPIRCSCSCYTVHISASYRALRLIGENSKKDEGNRKRTSDKKLQGHPEVAAVMMCLPAIFVLILIKPQARD